MSDKKAELLKVVIKQFVSDNAVDQTDKKSEVIITFQKFAILTATATVEVPAELITNKEGLMEKLIGDLYPNILASEFTVDDNATDEGEHSWEVKKSIV